MLNNLALQKDHLDLNENSLENNIEKLNITDTLIKNQKVKNVVLNNVAMMYLLEDQNMYNNQKFIERYLKLTTDEDNKKEITEIYNSVQNLKVGNRLPEIKLIDKSKQKVNINSIIKSQLFYSFGPVMPNLTLLPLIERSTNYRQNILSMNSSQLM